MDSTHLREMAHQFVRLASPLVASGALVRVGADTSDRVTALVQRAWGVVQRRCAGDEDAEHDLRGYVKQPMNTSRQQILVDHIVTHCADADAMAELRALVSALQAAQGRTMTVTGGQVGVVIQGDTQGNLTIGPVTLNVPAEARTGGGGTDTDTFAGYRAGLVALLARLGTAHPRFTEALTYEQRLRENLAASEREGDTETRRAERAAVIARLNVLVQETLGGSFNALCGE